jgi:hypothetical protein
MKTDIKDLMTRTLCNEVGMYDCEFDDAWELYEHLDYDGSIHELIDSSIDIYYYDLRKWAVDNWQFVEDAIEEGLCEGVSDYHKLIQAGQYLSLREDAQRYVEELYEDQDGISFNIVESWVESGSTVAEYVEQVNAKEGA